MTQEFPALVVAVDLFDAQEPASPTGLVPLAERLRPRTIDEYVGQEHLLGPGKALRRLLEEKRAASLILWGPPGTGKTTLARLLARSWGAVFVEFSAVLSGVADIRRVVEEARTRLKRGENTLLFVDEIHRFNKAQQDAFLPHVESGVITLLGATTENPSFEVIPALLSRCRVVVLKPLADPDLSAILDRALTDRERGLGAWDLELTAQGREQLLAAAQGDARRMLGALEVAAQTAPLGAGGRKTLDAEVVIQAVGRRVLRHDKAGDAHYDHISALHKSMRNSDVDAALYWLYRMLDAGEDPLYILRRITVFASEDVGLADPYALNQVVAARQAFELIGLPDGCLALAQAVAYLSLAPKSNAIYTAQNAIRKEIKASGQLEIPLHARNAPTKLMSELGYAEGYLYPHDLPLGVAPQRFLPEALRGRRFYNPTDRGREKHLRERLRWLEQVKRRPADGEGPTDSSQPGAPGGSTPENED